MPTFSLDAKDKKILYELDLNGREFISTIAKKVGLSKEVVNYRIKRLQEKGIIEGYHAIIDTSKTGFRIYRLFIKYQNFGPEKELEMLDYLKKHSNIGWVAAYESVYDVAVLFWARDAFSFREMCDEFLTKYGKYFQTIIKTMVMSIYNFKHNYLFNTEDYSQAIVGSRYEPASLDELDFNILKILAKDCRKTTLEIGKNMNLSPNTIKYRLKKLVESNVIVGYKTNINVQSLGYLHYKIFLRLYDMTEKTRSNLVGYLKASPNVIYITDAIGPADLEFEMHVKNVEQLHRQVRDLKLKFKDVIKNSSAGLIFKEHRINYLPSVNGENKVLK